MPYSNINELPESVKGLPDHAKNIFMNAFNSANKQGKDEETCMKIAWGAVKNSGYKQNDKGEWVKAQREINYIESPIIFKIPEGKKFVKEIIYEGDFVHPQDKDRKLPMTVKRFQEWVNNFKKGLVDIVYVPLNHSDSPEDNTGVIEDIWIGDSESKPGKKALFAKFNIILDNIAEKIGKTILGCSIGAERFFSPETGEDMGEILGHIALTNEPYIPHLGEFRAVAFSQDSDVKITNFVLERESEDKIKNKKEEEMDEREMLALKEKNLDLERKVKEAQDAAEMAKKNQELDHAKMADMEKANFEREVSSEIEKLVLSKKVLPVDKDKEIKFAISLGKEKGLEYISNMLAKRADVIDLSTKSAGGGNPDSKIVTSEKPKMSELVNIWKQWLQREIPKEKAFELYADWEKRFNLSKSFESDVTKEIKFKRNKDW